MTEQRRILKWTIPVDDHDHPIGIGAIVHVDVQGQRADLVQVWTDEWDTGGRVVSARVYGTGQPIPEDGEILGSALAAGGALVWHVVRSGSASGPADTTARDDCTAIRGCRANAHVGRCPEVIR